MTADIYTNGFNDIALFGRLRRLINIYSPSEIAGGHVRPDPLTADNTDATKEPGFDSSVVNTQYLILEGAKSTKSEDNKKVVEQKDAVADPILVAGKCFGVDPSAELETGVEIHADGWSSRDSAWPILANVLGIDRVRRATLF